MNSATDYEYLKMNWSIVLRIPRGCGLPTWNWFSGKPFGSSLCPSCWKKTTKSDSEIWTYCQTTVLTQDYFKASVNDTVKGTDCRRKGIDWSGFDIRNKKDFEILEVWSNMVKPYWN